MKNISILILFLISCSSCTQKKELTHEEEIEKLVKELKECAPGPDQIPAKVLKSEIV